MVWPRSLKKSRNDCRMLAVVQRIERSFYPSAAKLPTVFSQAGREPPGTKTTDARRVERPSPERAQSPCQGRVSALLLRCGRCGSGRFFFSVRGCRGRDRSRLEFGANLLLDLIGELGICLQQVARIFAALSDAFPFVRIPGAQLFDN